MCSEFAKSGVQRPGTQLFHHGFGAAAVLDQVGNGADFQAVFGRKQLQIGQTGHGAVVFHDFADDGSRGAASHASQVATGFGVAGAHQHAAVNGLQGEDVARLHQVVGPGVGRHSGFHRAGTVSG